MNNSARKGGLCRDQTSFPKHERAVDFRSPAGDLQHGFGTSTDSDGISNHGSAQPVLEGSQHRDYLARSAAPDAISRDAKVLVLGQHGYEAAVQGANGFVCVVEGGWMSPFEHPEFWNPKLRGPICFNPPAARSVWPLTIKRTELVLSN
jgi:hypothetical protein